ncbi:MAG: hypothetical protein HWE07_14085 [Cytophagia bacterium]|nr:hypothetical protein [Cytophagia bacterium]
MKDLQLKKKAFELFEEGMDIKSVSIQLKTDQTVVTLWNEEYNIQEGLVGLNGDPDQVEELLGAIKEFNELKREEHDLYHQEKEEAQLKEKRSKLMLFKKLFTFMKNHCQGFKWSYGEVILFIKKQKTLQEQVEVICGHDPQEFEKLFIWNRIVGLVEHLEQLVINKEERDTIKFNFDENDVLYLQESLQIEDFDDEIEVEIEEEQALNALLEEEFSPKKY